VISILRLIWDLEKRVDPRPGGPGHGRAGGAEGGLLLFYGLGSAEVLPSSQEDFNILYIIFY